MAIRKPTEGDIVRTCLQYLSLRSIPAWRQNTGGAYLAGRGGRQRFVRFGPPGMPDIQGVLPPAGRALFVECKTRTGKLRSAQEAFHARALAAGAVVLVVRSVGELADKLKEVLA